MAKKGSEIQIDATKSQSVVNHRGGHSQWYRQVEQQSATMQQWNQTIEVTVSQRKSSVAVWLYHRFT